MGPILTPLASLPKAVTCVDSSAAVVQAYPGAPSELELYRDDVVALLAPEVAAEGTLVVFQNSSLTGLFGFKFDFDSCDNCHEYVEYGAFAYDAATELLIAFVGPNFPVQLIDLSRTGGLSPTSRL